MELLEVCILTALNIKALLDSLGGQCYSADVTVPRRVARGVTFRVV